MLLDRDAPRDRENSTESLGEAFVIADELRMAPLLGRIAALHERLDDPTSSGKPTYVDRLTSREVEVLRLLASGGTNREIAAELVLSARTVERHISNIYGKIGARNRAEATAFALIRLAPSPTS